LFDVFPRTPTPDDSIRFQRLLAREILQSEAEYALEKTESLKEHLRAVRVYGDALAHTLLSRYAIRQLSRNPGNHPDLLGQGKAFQLAMDCAEALAGQRIPPLLADLTNVVRNGDLIACVDPNLPVMLECKLSKVKDVRFERQGRRGRQLSRLESIGALLRDGRGRVHGESTDRYTVEVTCVPRYSYAIVDEIVASALQRRPSMVTPSPNELYAATMVGEVVDSTSGVLQLWAEQNDLVAIGSSLDPLQSGTWDIPPPVLWDIGREAQWALMERDVAVSHAIGVGALVGLTRDNVRVTSVIKLPGELPWGYEVLVDDEAVTVSANVVLDVVYCHRTVESAGEMLLELAERVVTLMLRDA